MQDDRKDYEAKRLDERLSAAVHAAVAREETVGEISSWWRDIRKANNFRKSLQELFSGD